MTGSSRTRVIEGAGVSIITDFSVGQNVVLAFSSIGNATVARTGFSVVTDYGCSCNNDAIGSHGACVRSRAQVSLSGTICGFRAEGADRFSRNTDSVGAKVVGCTGFSIFAGLPFKAGKYTSTLWIA